MGRYYIAPDGENEPTIWHSLVKDDPTPFPVARRCDVTAEAWVLMVQGMALQ